MLINTVTPSEFPRKPWANTVAYFPFVEDTLDHSWNSTILNGSMTADTLGYKTSSNVYFTNANVNFLCCWFKLNTVWGSWNLSLMERQKNAISYYPHHEQSQFNKKIAMFYTLDPTYYSVTSSWDISSWWWHYIAYSYYDWKIYICKDWTTELLYNWSWAFNWNNIYLVMFNTASSGNITYSNLIAESAWWDNQSMVDYHNQTKANYGY